MRRDGQSRWIKILLATLPMLAVMVVIFVFSHRAGDASSEQSNAVGEWVLGILGIEIPPGQSASDVDIFWGFTIRKCAHIFLYLLLGASAFLFASCLPLCAERLWRPVVCGGGAVAISFLYACLDELHQAFVAGRGSKIEDVGIDAIGFVLAAVLCMAVWYLVLFICRKRTRKS